MVKINKTLGLALLTALAASCSSDNDVAQSNNPVIENGKGAYTKISINLPTTDQASPFSRAYDGEPSYDDGTEYSVNDGVVLVFQDVDGTDPVFTGFSALDLTHSSWSKAGGNKNVTTDASFVVNLPSYDAKAGTGNLILVLLNNKDKNDKDKVALPTVGQKYGDWNKAQATEAVGTAMQDNSKGFFMASAAGFYPVATLTSIDPANVTYDVNEASTLPATDVYVERGLAKVTMTKPDDKTVQAGRAYAGDKVSFSAWSLDVTNKKSFPVHTVQGMTYDFSKQPRFFSTIADPADENEFQRVYWGVDPNYSLGADYITGTDAKTKLADEFSMLASNASVTGAFGTPQYCLENTFDIDNMTQGQTTRVVIKATYTPKSITTANTTFYKLGNTSKLYTKDELETLIMDIIHKDLGFTFNDYKFTLDAKDNDITKAGTHTLSPSNFESTLPGSGAKTRASGSDPKDWDEKNGPDNINNLIGNISTYENGVCYYIGRIKHFGDVLTQWNPGDPTYGENNDANNAKYLGRYGVLRNNWYDLSLGTVTGPGDPTVPPVVPEKPDDEKNNYINLSVKILSWAKRSQTIDL